MWCARSLEPQLSDNVIAPWEAAPLSSLGKLSLLPGDRKITVWDTILKILLVGIWTKLDLAQKWVSALYKVKTFPLLLLIPNSALMGAPVSLHQSWSISQSQS